MLLLLPFSVMQASCQPGFSTAGFYKLQHSGREVFSMNPAWRFHKGNATSTDAIWILMTEAGQW